MINSPTTDTYAYMAGKEAGRALVDPQPSLERVHAQVRDHLAQELRNAEISLELVEMDRAWRAADLDVSDERYKDRNQIFETLEDEQDEKPAAYSRIRGSLYITFALVILVADFAILSQVIARVFGFSARSKGLGDPASALFKAPLEAMAAFGEVYLTSLGVLLLAMAFKVWNERLPRKPLPPHARFVEKVARFFEDHSQWVVLAVAVLSVFIIAYVRVEVDVGRIAATGEMSPAELETQKFLRLVTAIIGLACPFVGVLLFSRGLEAFGAGQRLRNLTKTAARLKKQSAAIRAEWEAHTKEQIEKKLGKTFLERPDQEELQLKMAADQFRLGYAAGVTEVLEGARPTGAYRKLRSHFPIQ